MQWVSLTFEDEDGDYLVDVKVKLHRGYRATRVDPEEPPSVELLDWEMRDGTPVPDWIDKRIESGDYDDQLMEEAREWD
jgi:hypothetical protein